MKTNKTLLIILFLLSIPSFAQQPSGEKKEQIRTLKVGFITNELSLTTEEASKFWPIYNAFDDKQYELKNQKMKAFKSRMDDDALDKMSEKEAAALLAQMENTEDDLYVLRKKFVANLKGVLPAKKIIKLKKAEDDFKRKLLQQYRDKGHKK
ncbi:MAG: sensor of ECF-type sigma factor [Flavobacterium sp.]|nr:sensor of ECF-type sigma factor [Flavobacterium sp.]